MLASIFTRATSLHVNAFTTIYQGDVDPDWLREIKEAYKRNIKFFQYRMNYIEVRWRGRVHKVSPLHVLFVGSGVSIYVIVHFNHMSALVVILSGAFPRAKSLHVLSQLAVSIRGHGICVDACVPLLKYVSVCLVFVVHVCAQYCHPLRLTVPNAG